MSDSRREKWTERGEWMTDMSAKSEEQGKDNLGERRQRKVQLFVQLLSSGCILTGVYVCVRLHVGHGCFNE